MAGKKNIDVDLIEEIEQKRGLSPGDFGRALDAFWVMLKYLITSEYGFTIHVSYFGIFSPGYRSVQMAIKKEIRKIEVGIGKKERLYFLLSLRRKMIDAGDAPRSYYLKKIISNGRSEAEREEAKISLQDIQGRYERVNKARAERKEQERRARGSWGGGQYGA